MGPPTKTTDHEPGDERFAPLASPLTAPGDPTSAATQALAPALAAVAGDRCAACGSRLAGDQRYCLECGERRGQARFAATPAAPPPSATGSRPKAGRGQRISAGTTLIAGVGTLLLAMGIGVLIGRSNTSVAPANSKVQVVNLGGSGASTANTPSRAAAGQGAGASSRTGKSGHGHRAAKSSTSAVQSSTTVKNLPPPTVTIGAKGHGPGYQKGHFTGKFFGP